uniref:GRF-type domain-containing protein n=1 Tax=Hordeum vulgare subsp. vulgare TaxID=112509 RepID=A0A8I6WYH1_HORVV
MASSSPSTGAHSSRDVGHAGYSSNPSPVPYREQPLVYEATGDCWCACKHKGARWISWSNNNPGRRYLKCQRSRVGGCDWFKWFDEPTTPFLRQLLVDLRNTVNKLRRENTRLRGVNADLEQGIEERNNQIHALRNVLRNMAEGGVQNKKGHTGQRTRMLLIIVPLAIFLIISIKLAG